MIGRFPLTTADAPGGDDPLLGIAAGLDLVLLSADEVLVQFGARSTPSELLRDADLTGVLGRVIGRLQEGPASRGALLAHLAPPEREEAAALIDDLLARGYVSDVRRSPVEQYLGYTYTGDTALADRRVGVLGVGPIGARLALGLLQHGIGRLHLLDDRPADRIWRSLLPIPASEPDQPPDARVDALWRDRLCAAGYGEVEALAGGRDVAGVETAVAAAELVVVASEQPDLRFAHLVNRVCLRERTPWLLATIDGNRGVIGPLFLPPHTACYNDFRTLADAATPSPEMAARHRRQVLRRGAGSFFPGLPAYADLTASYAALAVVQYLLRGGCFALGRALTIDFDRMLIDVEDVLKLPRCPVCGRENAAAQPPFSGEVATRWATMAPP